MKEKLILLDVKASLLDIYDEIVMKEGAQVELLSKAFQQLMRKLGAIDVKLVMNKRQALNFESIIGDRISHQSILIDDSLYREIESFFLQTKDTFVTVNQPFLQLDQAYEDLLMMKMETSFQLRSYLVLIYHQKQTLNKETVFQLHHALASHFEKVTSFYYEQFLRKRNKSLFELSTNLHSIYDTVDVLERVYRTMKLLYPAFHYRFLMSHEYEDTELPIYMMDHNDKESLGTKAFMSNVLEIEKRSSTNETVLFVPLAGKQGVYGVLEIIVPHYYHLIDDEINFLSHASEMIGRAVERTTLYQSSNRLINDLQNINTASRDFNQNLDRAEISEKVKKHIVNSCDADEIGLVFISQNKNGGDQLLITEQSTNYFQLNQAQDFVQFLYDRLKEKPEPIFSGNFRQDQLLLPYKSMMVMPMLNSEKLFGFIIITHEKPYHFSFEQYKFVQSFVQHASLAYANSILKDKLRKTAITDYLTKLYMRNFLDEQIDSHMQTSKGGRFILLDVDDFKLINDHYGHYVGDKVLVQIAEILKAELKENEIAARWGGEEFAIYLPDDNERYAKQVAETIRKKINEKTKPKVTVSIGIAGWNCDECSIEELFIKADKALYQAKQLGKNQIIVN